MANTNIKYTVSILFIKLYTPMWTGGKSLFDCVEMLLRFIILAEKIKDNIMNDIFFFNTRPPLYKHNYILSHYINSLNSIFAFIL